MHHKTNLQLFGTEVLNAPNSTMEKDQQFMSEYKRNYEEALKRQKEEAMKLHDLQNKGPQSA